jgi:hypothetical protein
VAAVTRTSINIMIKNFNDKDLYDVFIYVMHIYNNKYAPYADKGKDK